MKYIKKYEKTEWSDCYRVILDKFAVARLMKIGMTFEDAYDWAHRFDNDNYEEIYLYYDPNLDIWAWSNKISEYEIKDINYHKDIGIDPIFVQIANDEEAAKRFNL